MSTHTDRLRIINDALGDALSGLIDLDLQYKETAHKFSEFTATLPYDPCVHFPDATSCRDKDIEDKILSTVRAYWKARNTLYTQEEVNDALDAAARSDNQGLERVIDNEDVLIATTFAHLCSRCHQELLPGYRPVYIDDPIDLGGC